MSDTNNKLVTIETDDGPKRVDLLNLFSPDAIMGMSPNKLRDLVELEERMEGFLADEDEDWFESEGCEEHLGPFSECPNPKQCRDARRFMVEAWDFVADMDEEWGEDGEW